MLLLADRAIAVSLVVVAGASLNGLYSALDGEASRIVTLKEVDQAARSGWAGEPE